QCGHGGDNGSERDLQTIIGGGNAKKSSEGTAAGSGPCKWNRAVKVRTRPPAKGSNLVNNRCNGGCVVCVRIFGGNPPGAACATAIVANSGRVR
ncbi:unnamed protein product, partial [Tenebrio molitor]